MTTTTVTMKAKKVVIHGKHRATGKSRWLKNKTIYQDEKGQYIKFDRSSWYVKPYELLGEGYFHSTEYREYHG